MRQSDFTTLVRKLGTRFKMIEEGTDHIVYAVWFKGKLITRVKNSHSPKDYQDNLIAKNLHISRTSLREFVACTYTNDQVVTQMKRKNYWPADVDLP